MTYFGRLLSNAHAADAYAQAKRWTPRTRPSGFRSSKDPAYLRLRKRRMFERNPHCHWCGGLMVLLDHRGLTRVPYRPDEATFEHLDPRHSAERGEHPGEIRIVLAHARCNNERDRAQLAALPPQEHWRRSGQFHSIAKRSGALNEVTP